MKTLLLVFLLFCGATSTAGNVDRCRLVEMQLAAQSDLLKSVNELFSPEFATTQTIVLDNGQSVSYSYHRENSVRDIIDGTSGSREVLEIRYENILAEVAREKPDHYIINTYRDQKHPFPWETRSVLEYRPGSASAYQFNLAYLPDPGGYVAVAILVDAKYHGGQNLPEILRRAQAMSQRR